MLALDGNKVDAALLIIETAVIVTTMCLICFGIWEIFRR
jgi:hypothetical protein